MNIKRLVEEAIGKMDDQAKSIRDVKATFEAQEEIIETQREVILGLIENIKNIVSGERDGEK